MERLTWSCHFCGTVRDDAKISVVSKPIELDNGAVIGQQNRRYCNDSAACIMDAEAWKAER